MKRTLILLTIFVSSNIFAQLEPERLIDTFFTTYEKDAGKAVKDLYATNVWTEEVKDDIENIIETVNGLTESYVGKYYGYEHIATKKFSDSFLLYSYLVKYDRQPFRFIFKFYKPNDRWMFFSYSFDTDLDDEIEEAAKLYRLDKE